MRNISSLSSATRLRPADLALRRSLSQRRDSSRQSTTDMQRSGVDLCISNVDMHRSDVDLSISEVDLDRSDVDLCISEVDLCISKVDIERSNLHLRISRGDIARSNGDVGISGIDLARSNRDFGNSNLTATPSVGEAGSTDGKFVMWAGDRVGHDTEGHRRSPRTVAGRRRVRIHVRRGVQLRQESRIKYQAA